MKNHEIVWIDRRERMPTKDDQDKYGLILVWSVHDGIDTSSAANFIRYGGVCQTHWAHTPPDPVLDESYRKEVLSR